MKPATARRLAVRGVSETRERLYAAAERLMREKGYPATTVDEICAAAGVTKGGFFHWFTSKDHLGRELLERYVALRQAEHEALAGESDPLRRLYAHLERMAQRADDESGCIMGIFAQELSRTNPEIGRMCADAFGQWTALLEADLSEARARYAPHETITPRSLAEHFVALIEGSLILERVSPGKRVLQQNVEHFRRYLETIFGPPDPGGCITDQGPSHVL